MFKCRFGNIVPIKYWTILAVIVLIVNSVFLMKYFFILNRLDDELLFEDDFEGIFTQFDNPNVNPNLEYLITKSECKFEHLNDLDLHFIIAVNSNPRAREMRQTIRDSWGNYEKNAQTLFFLGAVKSNQMQREIEAENHEFGDIIQGKFIDNERNLSHKHTLMLKWFVENCSGAKYLIKIDDDVFANVPAIYDFLKQNKNKTDFLMGTYHVPEQCPRIGPSNVTMEEYASDYYPAYAEGHSIIYSADVIKKLFYVSHLVNFFWVEDVFVTGIMRSQINVDITSMENYILTKDSLDDMRQSTNNLPTPNNFMFSLPNLTISDQLMLWERTEWYRLGEKN